jgi:small conductance mechanosensitive channel
MNIENLQEFLMTTGVALATKVLGAIAFWIVGRWLIGKVISVMHAAMTRNHVDPTLTKYAGSIIAVALNIALVLGILGYFGIETTSIAAVLAGAGVAIGVAWSGLLAHFAAGAFLLILRPFKVGDFISAGGTVGTVKEIGLFATTIVTPDNVMTVVGNNKLFSDNIQNFTALPVRRVDRIAQLANGVDPLDAMMRFRAAIVGIPHVAQDPAPEVSLLDFKLEGPQIAVRSYTHNDHYWQVWFDTSEAIARVGKEANWPAPAATFDVRAVESASPTVAHAQALQDAVAMRSSAALATSPV